MQEVVNKIYQYVELSGLKIEPQADVARSQGLEFIGIVRLPGRIGYNVIVDVNGKTIIISTYYRFSQSSTKHLSNLKDNGFEFISNIQLALLQMNLHYTFIHRNDNPISLDRRTPIKIEDVASIEIKKILPFDGFNQYVFFETTTNIIHAIEVIDLLYRKMDLESLT